MHIFLSMLFMIFMIFFVFLMLRIILIMIMSTFFFHAFHMFLFYCINTIHQLQSLSPVVRHGLKNVFHPGIILTTYINKQITVLDRNNILWRRLIRMCLLARF